eukprot:1138894-Pelagomonas_calceolata.AAC.4
MHSVTSAHTEDTQGPLCRSRETNKRVWTGIFAKKTASFPPLSTWSKGGARAHASLACPCASRTGQQGSTPVPRG